MVTKMIFQFIVLSLAVTTGCNEIYWRSFDPGFNRGNSSQSCQDERRTCKCDPLCSFYRDCCQDYVGDGRTVPLYNQQNRSLESDVFECRSMPGRYQTISCAPTDYAKETSYWIISRCQNTTSRVLKTKCEKEYALDELVQVRYIRPVNDAFRNVYKNYYCAACHNIPPEEIMLWSMKEVCHDCLEQLPLSQDHFTNLSTSHCYNLLENPIIANDTHKENFDVQLRTCDKDMVRSCPPGSNANDRNMCSQFSSPGYFRGIYFKNIFCARCHGMDSTEHWSGEILFQCSQIDIMWSIGVKGAMSFLDPLCSLIRCSRKLSLCSGTDKSPLQFLSLTVNVSFRCFHMEERSENCFFQNSLLRKPTLPWKRMVGTNLLWDNDQSSSTFVTVFQLPENMSQNWRIHLDEDILESVRYISQTERSCYLEYVEVVEVCSDQEWERLGECNGDLVEVQGDEILDDENNFLNELTYNLSESKTPFWYSVHTRFPLEARSIPVKRTLVCFTYPEMQQPTIWFRIFCGVCIAIAILCHLATFVTYATFKPLRNTFGISLMCLVMSLAIALFLLQFVADYVSDIEYLCKLVAICSHYFWLSSFCWVTVLAWDLHVTLSPSKMRVRQASSCKRLAAYCCFGWGLPLIIVAVCITMLLINVPEVPVMYGSVRGMSCWIHDSLMRIIAVAGPLVGCIFANIILFSRISLSLYSYKKDSMVTKNDLANPKRRILELVVYIKVSMLMGFSWIFGFLADFTQIDVLWWFFYISYAIQACVIFVFFGLSAKVRHMWKESRVARLSTKSTHDS